MKPDGPITSGQSIIVFNPTASCDSQTNQQDGDGDQLGSEHIPPLETMLKIGRGLVY
jgi:hypothetical protein